MTLGSVLLVAGTAAGCRAKGAEGGPLTASLADTRSAQEAFRPLKQRFSASSPSARSELEPRLRWFVAAYPEDGQVPLARVYLALVAVHRGDVAAARAELSALESSPRGNTRDMAELVWAALSLHAGEHARAYQRLSGLVGKLVDPYARTLLDEQVVAAALGTGRWYEAVAYMDLWLRDASEHNDEDVQERVRKSLEAVPSDALEQMMQTTLRRRAPGGWGAAVRQAVMGRLAAVAIEQQDTELARRLVESAAGSRALGDSAEALHELAELGGAAVADGRTVGLLLSTGANELGARAAEVLSGVVDALRSDGTADGVRLITRDERDPKRTELALRSLASQGAVVLIAGLDPLQGRVARAFAQRTGIPTLAMTGPLVTANDPASALDAYTLGEEVDSVAPALLGALVRGGGKTCAVVGGPVPAAEPRLAFTDPTSCRVAPAQAGESRFPTATWRAAGVDCLLVLGESSCAADAVAESQRGNAVVRVLGLGLRGADLVAEPMPLPVWVTAAGRFPLRSGDASSPLAGYARRQGKAPSWWAALGHDAVVLARAALRELPATRSEVASEVTARHRAVTATLARVEVDLWTSNASGFAGGHALPRELEAREVR